MWSAFFELSILPETLRFSFRFRNLKKMFSVESTKKGRPHFGSSKIRSILFVNFRIMLVKLGLRIKAENYFNGQRRPSIRLCTVIFCWTPCSWEIDKDDILIALTLES